MLLPVSFNLLVGLFTKLLSSLLPIVSTFVGIAVVTTAWRNSHDREQDDAASKISAPPFLNTGFWLLRDISSIAVFAIWWAF